MSALSSLAELHAECFPNKPWSAADFAELQKSGAEIIASDNSFIVWRSAADEAEIITVGVRTAARGTGTATALIGLMENELRKKNVKKVFLEVAADNFAALGLYRKNGFDKIGDRQKYYDGVDAITMEKNIA
jgi:ribosomal-protein-alanine N-acetyltransferase